MTHSTLPSRPASTHRLKIAASSGFGLVELHAETPLVAQLLPTGAVFALRHGPTLINQLLPGPAEDGLFRLLLRWRDPQGRIAGWAPLVGAGLQFGPTGPASAAWSCTPLPGVYCETHLELHADVTAWYWRIHVHNTSASALSFDVLHAQDLGLGDEAAVRNNEAYTSHYIDLLPVRDRTLGWTLFARQNQAMTEGRRPWLAVACTSGAAEFCTDGWQFFGPAHRLTNEPAAARASSLPSCRLQYEFALAGLQSRPLELTSGASGEIVFIARFLEDHPTASSPSDLAYLRDLVSPLTAPDTPSNVIHYMTLAESASALTTSLFVRSAWLHGDDPAAGDWSAWFPGERRHEEFAADASLLAFFHGAETHVVARAKEATLARPHGHILRTGDSLWFDSAHFGVTCYAAGIFGAQAYLGHPSFARLLSVVRNALNVTRGSGQRVFVRREGAWRQLGVPSAFAMTPADVRWIYRFGDELIEARVQCARDLAAAFLELRVLAGPAREFLVTHELALGAAEFDHPAEIEVHAEAGWIACHSAAGSLLARHEPAVTFAIAAADPAHVAALGGDRLLYADGVERGGPYATLQTTPVKHCGVILLGTHDGTDALPSAVADARAVFASTTPSAHPPPAPVRLHAGRDAGVSRIDDVLPWFTHNAAIHFSAPHGLEQYGGAAWGVRDVCQGSVEWLLAAGQFAVVRRILETVFAQQYLDDGNWPQWFMFPPYRFIQQAHSHGDVCFWPVKALCDYVEASNDTAFLREHVGYTDPQQFEPCGPSETLLAHCDRVIAQCEARFVAGTALVNYGDGDWDDTLQPADPTMRTRMISAWTVGLAFHTFRQLAEVCRRDHEAARAARLDTLVQRMRRDFAAQLMPGGIVAGFLICEPNADPVALRVSAGNPAAHAADHSAARARPMLHPTDVVTRIRYRLLPMTRSILAELFTPDEARRHLEIIEAELRFPDGVRLMSEPSTYQGGVERLFKRAETAANVGREIGLQYVHAHLRYAEALAKVGDAAGLWTALQVVNPVALAAVVPNAAPRQSNVYFSSSDADFADRYEAARRWPELRTGQVAVRGGWRLYSSGPGIFLHKVRACLLGLRESFDDVVFDPVLPPTLDGLIAETTLCGRPAELRYHVREGCHSPRAIIVNGVACDLSRRDPNPYRPGGCIIARARLATLLTPTANIIEIDL